MKGQSIQDLTLLIYEETTDNLDWIYEGAAPGTWLRHSDDTLVTVSELVDGLLIKGAPDIAVDDDNTTAPIPLDEASGGYGINLIFGDSSGSFTANYTIDNVSLQAVPTPAAAGIGLALMGVLTLRRNRESCEA